MEPAREHGDVVDDLTLEFVATALKDDLQSGGTDLTGGGKAALDEGRQGWRVESIIESLSEKGEWESKLEEQKRTMSGQRKGDSYSTKTISMELEVLLGKTISTILSPSWMSGSIV